MTVYFFHERFDSKTYGNVNIIHIIQNSSAFCQSLDLDHCTDKIQSLDKVSHYLIYMLK